MQENYLNQLNNAMFDGMTFEEAVKSRLDDVLQGVELSNSRIQFYRPTITSVIEVILIQFTATSEAGLETVTVPVKLKLKCDLDGYKNKKYLNPVEKVIQGVLQPNNGPIIVKKTLYVQVLIDFSVNLQAESIILVKVQDAFLI